MAKKLAIEWDTKELRVVAGTIRGDRVTITDVASMAIESTEPQALGQTLKRLLAEHGLEKSSGGILLGRGKAELRELKLPPVPDAEVPDMVRFQAIRTFAAAGDKSAIDYLPTRKDEDGIRVLAAAVTPDELKRCALVAVPSQTSVERLVLRPLAAATFYRHYHKSLDGETVLIDLLAEDADIVVLRDGVPVFVRSIRLPDEMENRVRSLSGEVRRSLMASQDAGTDKDCPRRVILWGRAEVHAQVVEGLSKSLGTNVTTVDPFSLVDVESKLRERLPQHVGRLAPLIGLLDADARNDQGLIDFLNPRRPPDPPSPTGRYVVIGAAVAALVGVVLFLGWKKLGELDSDIEAQQFAYNDLEDVVQRADEAIVRTGQVDQFLDGNVFWLEELRRTAESMPPSDEAILESINGKLDRNDGGVLTLNGGVTSPSVSSRFEQALRDSEHSVNVQGPSQRADKAPYDWSFSGTVTIGPEYVRRSRELEQDQTTATDNAPEPEPETTQDSAELNTPVDQPTEPLPPTEEPESTEPPTSNEQPDSAEQPAPEPSAPEPSEPDQPTAEITA